jgi:hypothetical protein
VFWIHRILHSLAAFLIDYFGRLKIQLVHERINDSYRIVRRDVFVKAFWE